MSDYTPHTHRVHVEGCFRCGLGRDEVEAASDPTELEKYAADLRADDAIDAGADPWDVLCRDCGGALSYHPDGERCEGE